MPLEELLALYGYREMQESESPIEDDAEQSETMEEEQESESDPPEEPSSKLCDLYDTIPGIEQDASRLLRSVSRVSEEEEEDYDYSPDEDEWRKVNKVALKFVILCLFTLIF